jgi:hypothetical protein
MIYKINSTGQSVVADQVFMDAHYVGDYTMVPDATPALPNPCQWLIDIGPFFDRFGAQKISVLADADATVKAIVTDCMSRKWIDLQRVDVGQAIDIIIAKGHAVSKSAILTTAVADAENLALRKLYF